MKCIIIIFSLSSMKLSVCFFISEAESIWEILLYSTHIWWRKNKSGEEQQQQVEGRKAEHNFPEFSFFVCTCNTLSQYYATAAVVVFILVGFRSGGKESKWRILKSKLSLKLKRKLACDTCDTKTQAMLYAFSFRISPVESIILISFTTASAWEAGDNKVLWLRVISSKEKPSSVYPHGALMHCILSLLILSS
jgi:hypothetical protein